MKRRDRSFGGRLRPKEEELSSWADLVKLPNERIAFIYKRLSSHEQVKKSIYSIKAQDALYDLAKQDGYPGGLIYIGERDLGISGTLGREDRPELAYLIESVEADKVEAVYTVHISRLYRDQTLINALALGELFKKHGVIIVTPQVRLNLKDKMHMKLYRMEVERAADELELMARRMLGARAIKAKSGLYAGEKLPPGYIVDERRVLEDGTPNPAYHSYLIYEPHARVVRAIFELVAVSGMTPTKVARYCEENKIVLAPFPPELDTPANRKTYVRSRRAPDGSWPITIIRVYGIISNPAYIGWKIWGGEVVSKEIYPPIIDKATFWSVQEHYGRSGRPKKNHDPLPFAGLLYCGSHDLPRRMTYFNKGGRGGADEYSCIDSDLRHRCCTIVANILEEPICEAIIGQLTLPDLSGKVLDRLTDEYEQAKEQSASYRREMKRLEDETENLRNNLASSVMSTEQLGWIDQQIQARLTRIRELADLEKRPIGAVVGRPVPGKGDIDLVRAFLRNLDETWHSQPNGLKNALLQLLLDRIVIRPEPETIKVRLAWRTGLEQKLIIYRRIKGGRQEWTEAEIEILREHYATGSRDELMSLIPGRTLNAINVKAKRLKLHRAVPLLSKRKGAYTSEEDELVRRFYAGGIDLDTVLCATGRTLCSIECRARRLKLGHRKLRVWWEWLDNGGNATQEDGSSTQEGGSSRPG